MARLILSTAAAVTGYFICGPMCAKVGWFIGDVAGAYLFPEQLPDIMGPRINDLRIMGSSEGAFMPRVYGTFRLGGNLIWFGGITEHKTTTSSGGKGGGPSQSTTTYSYTADFAVGVCQGTINAINKIWANGELIYDGTPKSAITIHTGAADQLPDSLIQAAEGTDNTPGFRGLCYVVFNDLNLDKYGGRLPQLSFEIERAASDTAQYIIQDLCLEAGLTTGSIDVSEVSTTCRGYAVTRAGAVRSMVEPILRAYNLAGVETASGLKFFDYAVASTVAVDEAELGASFDAIETSKLAVHRTQDMELPRKVSVLYVEKEFDYQPSKQQAQRYLT